MHGETQAGPERTGLVHRTLRRRKLFNNFRNHSPTRGDFRCMDALLAPIACVQFLVQRNEFKRQFMPRCKVGQRQTGLVRFPHLDRR